MLYFSHRGAEEALVIGSTKLNKLMFYADFRAYAELGEPITGARYQKLDQGPAPRALLPMRQQLLVDGVVEYRAKGEDDLNDVLVPLGDPPGMDNFTGLEMKIVDDVFDENRELNARAISDDSHKRSVGWQAVDLHQDIPYESVYMTGTSASDWVIRRGRELAAKYGW